MILITDHKPLKIQDVFFFFFYPESGPDLSQNLNQFFIFCQTPAIYKKIHKGCIQQIWSVIMNTDEQILYLSI